MKAHLTKLTLTLAAVLLLVVVAAEPAAAETQTFRSQDTFSVFVPCADNGNGEVVNAIVKVHAVLGQTFDDAGGAHFHLQLKLQGVGLGSVTGDTYQLHADIPEIFFDRLNDNAGGSMNGSITLSIDAVGLGDAPNFHQSMRLQATQNANGDITMEKEFDSATCN